MTLTMTDPQTLNVEYEELMARADELEAPIPGLPTDNPQAPCALGLATKAAAQMGLSADNMRLYLAVGERERRRLAESLRNAAKAYEEVDEEAEDAVNSGSGSVSAATVGRAEDDLNVVTLGETMVAAGSSSELDQYPDLKQNAIDIAVPDQGAALDSFADEWIAHQRALLEATYRFRPFQYWYGDATYAVEMNFDQHRSWMYQMAELCGLMATQAQTVASVHRWAYQEHPMYPEIKYLEDLYQAVEGNSALSKFRAEIVAEYAKKQQKSEEVLAEYTAKPGLPLPPMNPPKPPTAHHIDPPSEPGPEEEVFDPYTDPELGPEEDSVDTTVPPTVASATDTVPSTPDATGLLDDTPLTEALTAAPNLSTGSGIKPASFGGGVGGGVPSMPLQSPVEPAVAAARAAGPAGLTAGAGGAMGGRGGMGMMPMAPGAGQGQQGAKQGKRASQEEQSLYIDKRPWTGPVIGARRRNGIPETGDGGAPADG